MTQATSAVAEGAKPAKRWHFGEEVVLNFILLAIVLIFLGLSLQYPPEARFVPMLILVPLVLGLSAETVRAMRREPKTGKKGGDTRATLVSVAWVTSILVLMYLGGLIIGIGLFVLAYMKGYCEERWGVSLLVTAIVGAGVWTFLHYLGLPMYWGVIPEALGVY